MDLRDFDLNLLVVLHTLLLERSVSKTAVRLHLSQPATSAALNRLRKALNDPILVREGLRMVPTSRAQGYFILNRDLRKLRPCPAMRWA
jgi:DNA-binding transcriptional LysR family regulator